MQALKKFYFGKSKFKPFVSTWKTDNLSTGSSTATQVKLPLVSTGSYNFVVEWGDGTQSTITAWNQAQATKTYTVAGTYTITIKGKCIGWVFNNTGDRLKILSVQQWGSLSLGTNQGNYFYGCANLNLSSVSDMLNLSGLSSISYCFRACSSITTINRINEWNLMNLNPMGLFYSCTSFNQDLGLLNVSNATSFSEMFFGCNLFNNGGSSSINNWVINTGNNISFFGMFRNAPAFNQPIGNWDTSRVTTMSSMFQSATAFNQNLSSWNTSSVTDSSSVFNEATSFNNGLASGVAGNMLWDLSSATNTNLMFTYASSFNQNLGALNLPLCTNFTGMFQNASKFNNGGSSDISNWTFATTGYISFSDMFRAAVLFNQPIGNWNTSRVTNMSGMFRSAIAFHQDLNWNTSNVTTMARMFFLADGFTDSIINFSDTSKVTDLGNFSGQAAGFYGIGVENFNTSSVVNMTYAFYGRGAKNFNRDLSNWNVSNVANFDGMFYSASNFNNGGSPGINNWQIKNTGNVSMTEMFTYTNFNQPISNWNMSRVVNTTTMFLFAMAFNNGLASGVAGDMLWNLSALTNANSMFSGASAFNQNLGALNLSNCANLNHMFSGANKFNNGGSTDINNWTLATTGNISMSSMFSGAFLFNQPIGSWNISNVTDFTNFMSSKTSATFSKTNLDAIYNGWSSRPVKTPITITFGTIKYTAASAAGRAILTSAPNNWVITDGGI